MLNWNDVVEVTLLDAKQSLLGLLNAVGFAATSWQEGSVPLACVEMSALVWSKGTQYAVFLKSMALNPTSTGEALTRFSASRFANQRKLAIAATRKITLACAAGQGPYTLALGDVVVEDSQRHTFRNVAGLAVVYPVLLPSGGAVQLVFEAEVAGAASQVAPSAVNSLVTTFAGVTVAGDLPLVTGQDEESDSALQARNSSKWATLGFELIKDGAENIALNTIGVTRVAVDDANPRGQATFDVYIAQPGATATSDQVLTTQAAFNRRVFGDTLTCRVIAAPSVALDLVGVVYYDSHFSALSVRAAVESAIVAFIATVPLGGFSFAPGPTNQISLSDIITGIKEATFSGQRCVRAVTLTTPAADISIAAYAALIAGNFSGLTYSATNG